MYLIKSARLVYLANPKTATQSVRAMLDPFAKDTPEETRHKHINMRSYMGRWLVPLVRQHGFMPETVSVMRSPFAHMVSWYRYRQRAALRGHENSTYGISFADFVRARLEDTPPPFAKIGRQDHFLGYHQGRPLVNYICDYARLDALVDFFSTRLGQPLSLPHHNVSERVGEVDLTLPPDLQARYEDAHADEFTLYARVQSAVMLYTPNL